ncbi:hypothetical protein KHC28_00455 [Ancylobacter sonchi]|uniref:hypothetical protein n=1 Tax=Ancylobacter sonchi TaxID=1937790 RepID=UPI001BD6CD5B|nr:hypothetical protein [Ancylobacter sonchi]MBS7532136.1 hypothetical protein [Ancylobacter sonchi]
MSTMNWPAVLVPKGVGPELRGSSKSGGRTGTGRQQQVFSQAGYWEFAYSIQICNRAQVLAWRALKANLRSGGDVLLKVYDLHTADGALNEGEASTLAADADEWSTTLSIRTTARLEPGVQLSLGDRLYQVQNIVSETGVPSLVDILLSDGLAWDDRALWNEGAPVVITIVDILPPMRGAAAAGTDVELEHLVCRCVLATISDGDAELDLGRFADIRVTFSES